MTEPLDRLKVALAERYAIERELGQGGMATVYLARDLKHDRLVAVKVLDPDLAASIGADRFLREIQVTAKLSHPHILPLYDSGEADGFLYYVMPFVQGESLADRIAREKQLSIKDAVQITREVAEALAQAHSHGLVHRDIKPGNILMSGGHAIVADFGIATAVSQAGGEKLTKTGMSIGTPAYMSPEQAMGLEVDGRSDIYSLGCMLYEMLVGQIPFTGTTPQQIIARHSMDHVSPPSIMRNTIPGELEEIVLRSMAKLPADRYRTAYEMAEALAAVDTATTVQRRVSPGALELARRRRWRRILVPAGTALGAVAVAGAAFALLTARRGPARAASGGLDPKRIAVRYFEDLSRDKTLEHVADGLTEGLIEELSYVRGLDVVSRNGVAPFRNANVSRDSIARALQAGSLIEGSIEPVGERVQVTVRLLEGASGDRLAGAGFELPADQLLAVRDSVVREVARLLRARLGEQVQLRERRAGTANVEAWGLVQRAERLRKYASGLARTDSASAREAYQQADSLLQLGEVADPAWAEPVVLRAQVWYERAFREADRYRRAQRLETVVSEVTRALEREPGHPRALALRGAARRALYGLNVTPNPQERSRLLDSAEADLKSATDADGMLAAAWLSLSGLYYDRKDNVSAAIAARRAYEADAFLRNQNANLFQLFWTHYDLEQFPDAERWCQEGARRFPADYRFAECRLWMMTTPGAAANVQDAWRVARVLDSLTPKSDSAYLNHLGRLIVGGALARAGLADSARKVLLAARAGRDVDPDQELPGYEAVMRTILGDYDEAVSLLKSYVLLHPTHEFNVGRDLHWWWRPLRDHPGFQTVVAPER